MSLQRPATLTDEFLERLVARVPSTSGGTWKLTEVYTGDVLVELPQSTPEDVAAAYATARSVQAEWAARPLRDRLAVFKRAHSLFIDNAHTTTDLIQAESGKNRRMAIEETCDPVMVMSHYLSGRRTCSSRSSAAGRCRCCPPRPRSGSPRGSSGSSRPGTS